MVNLRHTIFVGGILRTLCAGSFLSLHLFKHLIIIGLFQLIWPQPFRNSVKLLLRPSIWIMIIAIQRVRDVSHSEVFKDTSQQ